jgi:hypothetical protein
VEHRDQVRRQTGTDRTGVQDEPHAPPHQRVPAERVEHLKQLELVAEILLEPEHDLFARPGGRQHGVAGLESAAQLDRIAPAFGGQELRPLQRQRPQRKPGPHWPLVERVAPRQDLTLDPGRRQPTGGFVAVGDVQEARLAHRRSF